MSRFLNSTRRFAVVQVVVVVVVRGVGKKESRKKRGQGLLLLPLVCFASWCCSFRLPLCIVRLLAHWLLDSWTRQWREGFVEAWRATGKPDRSRLLLAPPPLPCFSPAALAFPSGHTLPPPKKGASFTHARVYPFERTEHCPISSDISTRQRERQHQKRVAWMSFWMPRFEWNSTWWCYDVTDKLRLRLEQVNNSKTTFLYPSDDIKRARLICSMWCDLVAHGRSGRLHLSTFVHQCAVQCSAVVHYFQNANWQSRTDRWHRWWKSSQLD